MPCAFPAPPKSHTEAISALSNPEVAIRLEAIAWLADYGTMSDAPRLHERLRDEDPTVRDYAEQGLWALWTRSGDKATDALMARGIDEMETGKLAAAITTFSEIVKRKPDFAEGWNKRATVYYLAGEYEKSIADCDQVLKRNPGHFGALSGLGQIYFQLEQYDQSLAWFRKALDVNPNMVGVELNIKRIESLRKERRGVQI
ncbi:MAG: tetratricopeptide repeat protein [Betaproteobacteria bacterium]|nr:tetratricopeptide repeat protein [Betaproteobacteria bacterium]MBV9361518.1 tetratricopeptide repeat protein [Betaproteobacteria bacterium]